MDHVFGLRSTTISAYARRARLRTAAHWPWATDLANGYTRLAQLSQTHQLNTARRRDEHWEWIRRGLGQAPAMFRSNQV
jgi:hypothetical protein